MKNDHTIPGIDRRHQSPGGPMIHGETFVLVGASGPLTARRPAGIFEPDEVGRGLCRCRSGPTS